MERNRQGENDTNLLKAMENKIHFNTKKEPSIIKVIGVGGGGGNAVNHMFKQGIEGVDFVVCNTDMQALEASPVPVKVQLGSTGLGAGSIPEVAEKAAIESLDKLKSVLDSETQMVFITAGMGGGTGTGAAPVIAKYTRELGLLSVGIVTLPFRFEGRRKMLKAEQGIAELRKYVDTLLVISNDKLREQYGDLGLKNAFARADDVLTTAARGIAELITVHGYVNVDFEDVKTVMKDSGKAIMGSAVKSGEDRAYKAIEEAMQSPLLDDNDITGARNILLYIATGPDEDVTMDEITVITDYIADKCGDNETDVIWGRGFDDNMGESLGVTIIATGFKSKVTWHDDILFHDIKPGEEKAPENEKTELVSTIKEDVTETKPESVGPVANKKQEGVPKAKPVSEEKHSGTPKIVHTLDEDAGDKHTAESVNEPVATHDAGEQEQTVIHKLVRKQPADFEKTETAPQTGSDNPAGEDELDQKMRKASEERKKKLANLSMLKSTPVSEQEKVPAYKRRNVQLSEPNYSKESQVSRYTLS
ncbi:MAG TPA: cell division protein FtsZ, partial [Bacteroidetes bacterium]|nr:cell division protein FtsZ [Bacteroidota bacterium]